MNSTTNPAANQLAHVLHSYLGEYLPFHRNASRKTITSYRDGLRQLLVFAAARKHTTVSSLTMADLTIDCVLAFLTYLECERGVGISTRNQRLAAIRSFFRHAVSLLPECMLQGRRILELPLKKTSQKATVYLEKDEMALLLGQPDRSTHLGQRDHLIITLMYNTGCRVQELVQLRPCDLLLQLPSTVRLIGKGDKERVCPLWPQTVELLRSWLKCCRLAEHSDDPLFLNQRRQPLTRFGVRTMLRRHWRRAQAQAPGQKAKNMHPHLLRHTTAVHLLQAGVELNMIREILGHVSINTTNRYAQIDMNMKRKALSTLPQDVTCPDEPDWTTDQSLLTWLESL